MCGWVPGCGQAYTISESGSIPTQTTDSAVCSVRVSLQVVPTNEIDRPVSVFLPVVKSAGRGVQILVFMTDSYLCLSLWTM